jgi:hypothetical protein
VAAEQASRIESEKYSIQDQADIKDEHGKRTLTANADKGCTKLVPHFETLG